MRAHERRGLSRADVQGIANVRWHQQPFREALSMMLWLADERRYILRRRLADYLPMGDSYLVESMERCHRNIARLRTMPGPAL